MASDGSIPLRTFVYRTLTLRLGVVTLALVLAVAAFTYTRERHGFEVDVTGLAQHELVLLMDRARRISTMTIKLARIFHQDSGFRIC
jgi:hypothetical protein